MTEPIDPNDAVPAGPGQTGPDGILRPPSAPTPPIITIPDISSPDPSEGTAATEAGA